MLEANQRGSKPKPALNNTAHILPGLMPSSFRRLDFQARGNSSHLPSPALRAQLPGCIDTTMPLVMGKGALRTLSKT